MNESGDFRVALVGCGAVVRVYYAPALRELARIGAVRVSALVDPDPAAVESLRAQFPSAHPKATPDDLVPEAVDLAIVASPPRLHAAQTIALLGRGIAVLCEKPMAPSEAEAERMIDAGERAGRPLAVAMVRRFLPACRTVKAILSRGLLGSVRRFDIAEGGRFRWPTRSPAYFQPGPAAGGVLGDIGSHVLDLLVWWMGEPEKIRYEDDAMGGVEANCRIEMSYREGFAGRIRLSRDCELSNRSVVYGSKGWLSWSTDAPGDLEMRIDGDESVLAARLHRERSLRGLPAAGRRTGTFEEGFLDQLGRVVEALRNNGRVPVSGREVLPSIRLIERCYRSRRLMPMDWLDDAERARAESLSGGTVGS